MRLRVITIIVILCATIAYRHAKAQMEVGMANKNFKLVSKEFNNESRIPSKFTCDSKDVSPHLKWENIPDGTQSLVLIVDDPDAKPVVGKTFVHWIVYNIPPDITEFPEEVDVKMYTNEQAKEAPNDFNGKKKYGGPCPPDKEHKYIFELFALDVPTIELTERITRDEFNRKFKDAILGSTVLTGKYERK